MRKYLSLAATLGLLFSVMAIRPAAATHSVDNVVANVNGGVNLDVDNDTKADADGDFDGDVLCNVDGTNPAADARDNPDIPGCDDDPDEACTSGGTAGDKAQFTDVRINGLFIGSKNAAGADTIGGFIGEIDVGTVGVCVVDDITTHDTNADNDPDNDGNGNGTNDLFDPNGDGDGDIPPVPLTAHGHLDPATFTTIGVGVNALNPLAGACLTGNLVGGTFTNTGAVTSRALITANWEVRNPSGGSCAVPGTLIAKSNGNVGLEADVAVVPAGLVTGGSLPDVVSAQVHSVHP